MDSTLNHVDILDTTLRDGSYTIGYQFTADETALIAHGLELSGINYIEVGHGLGLGADRAGKGAQAVTDLVYMRACSNSIRRAKFGFFYIPGIGELSDLKLLADEGGAFVRVGVSLDAIDQACHAIQEAKRLGLEVWANIMKIYAYSLQECRAGALRFVEAGADGVYVVDSAGGMLPSEVADYVSEIKQEFNLAGFSARIGFHGHDNLSLSTAGSLSAVGAGCDIVDGSLLGIGRSIGNAATEVLAMVLSRAGYETGVNAWSAADLAEKTIRPFLEQRWRHSALEQALGFAQIHSGFLPVLEKAALHYEISLRDVVLVLGHDARRHISEEDAMSAAEHAKEQALSRKVNPGFDAASYTGNIKWSDTRSFDIVRYANAIRSQSLRMDRPSVIVIAGPWLEHDQNEVKLQEIRLLTYAVVGAIEVSDEMDLERIVTEIDGKVDVVFLDKTPRFSGWNKSVSQLESRNWISRQLPYGDEIAGLISACHIVAIEAGKRGGNSIALYGEDARTKTLQSLFPYWGISIVDSAQASIIVVAGKTEDNKPLLSENITLVYDLVSGAVTDQIARDLLQNGVEVIRLDGRAAIVGEVLGLLDAQNLVDNIIGRATINSVPVVAGGVWGEDGVVVVNSIKNPSEVIGIADGNGRIKSQLNETDSHSIESVRKAIKGNLIADVMGFKSDQDWQD
ncbi:MAG: 4-hydroxy-2-oxovalerate aldolase [Chlorobiaceae bacterium]